MTQEVKYSFFDQIFSVSSDNLKNTGTSANKYLELSYPGDNSIPVLKYAEKNYLPIRIIIKSASGEADASGSYNYLLVLETKNSDDKKLFVRMKLQHDNAAAANDGPLTSLATAITNLPTARNVSVSMNRLITDGMTGNIYKHNASDNLTLSLTDPITTKLVASISNLTANYPSTEIIGTLSTTDPPADQITMVQTTLTQRQVCRRATDNASPSVSVVTQPKIPDVQTNVLVLTIIGLCVAAFFPSMYSIMVCLPAGKSHNYHSVHMVYLFGILGIVVALFVRGFREGDAEAQIWGIGLSAIFLIFFTKYYIMSAKNMLQCGITDVQSIPFIEQLGTFFEARRAIIFIVITIIAMILSSVFSNNALAFKIMIALQVIVTVLFLFLFR